MRGFFGLGNWFGANQSRCFASYYKAPTKISYASVFIFRADGFSDFASLVLILPNVQGQTRLWLARSVLLGARSVTAIVVVCSDWLGSVVFSF
jgi:hypothetical protein